MATTGNFRNPEAPQPHIWLKGKVEPGWYCASWVYSERLATHWKALGYDVVVALHKPE